MIKTSGIAAGAVLVFCAAALAATPVTGELPVNTTTAGDQGKPSLAMDSDGDFVVAWHGPDGSVDGVFARRYNAAGTPVTGEVTANTTITNDQDEAAVAMDASGDFVVAWESYNQDATANSDGIFARRFDAAGAAVTGEIPVNTTTGDDQKQAAVAMDASGDFVVAWTSDEQDGSNTAVIARRFNAAGVPVSAEIPVNTTTANVQNFPSVAMDASGDFVVSWESYGQDGDREGVFARRFNAAAVPVTPEIPVNTTTADSQRFAAVAMDASGDFVVAWESFGYAVHARRFNAAGAPAGGEIPVSRPAGIYGQRPAVAMDADGDFAVAWHGADGSVDGIFTRHFSAAGTPLSGELTVNTTTTNDQDEPAVAMDASGDFAVAWESYNQDGPLNTDGVFARRYNVPRPAASAPVKPSTGIAPGRLIVKAKPRLRRNRDGTFTLDTGIDAACPAGGPACKTRASAGTTIKRRGSRKRRKVSLGRAKPSSLAAGNRRRVKIKLSRRTTRFVRRLNRFGATIAVKLERRGAKTAGKTRKPRLRAPRRKGAR